jgi:hypothetical protein
MNTLRENETMLPWPISRSRAAFAMSSGKGVMAQRSISSWGRAAVGTVRTPDAI